MYRVIVNTALLATYATRTIRPAGDVAPCPQRSGVPAVVALLTIAAAGGLGYVVAGVDADRRAREAYALGKRGAPRPSLL